MRKSALILGPTGRFGGGMQAAFEAAGWKTKAFSRSRHNLMLDAKSHDVIVYGWNPGFQNWAGQARKCLQVVIEAAERHGCTILFPGNVLVYGDASPEVMTEDTPHAADNPLGMIRVEMEQMLARSSAQVIILRGGDFLNAQYSGAWFDGVIARKINKGFIRYPGRPDAVHAFAYLPDFARAFVMLAEKRAELDRFTTLNFEGYSLTGQEMADILGVEFRKFNWRIIWFFSFYFLFAHGLQELRYLWDMPHRLDGRKFREVLPDFQPTPVEVGLRRAASLDIDPNEPMVAAGAAV